MAEERIYFGNFEVYCKYVSNVLETERRTLHISDGTKNIAFIDTLTIENGTAVATLQDVVRYQHDNHLGSASLELDENAATISYEEYHPFGTSSYRLHRNSTEASLKRYRYVGKERDEETGFYYYGARYYAAWIGRWTAVDPMANRRVTFNPYNYCQNNPINRTDPTGALDSEPPNKSTKIDIDPLTSLENLATSEEGKKALKHVYQETAVDMNKFKANPDYSYRGAPKNAKGYWNNLLKEHKEWFSKDNIDRILGQGEYTTPRSPVVDEQWVKHFENHSEYMDDVLTHHHWNNGSIAVAIPQKAHAKHSKFFHALEKALKKAGTPKVHTKPGQGGKIARGKYFKVGGKFIRRIAGPAATLLGIYYSIDRINKSEDKTFTSVSEVSNMFISSIPIFGMMCEPYMLLHYEISEMTSEEIVKYSKEEMRTNKKIIQMTGPE